MNRNYFLIFVGVAIVCLFLIFFSIGREIASPVTKDPLIPPPLSPYKEFISGEGIVEASSDNIYIGTSVNRVVDRVLVKVGDKVKKGSLLFCLEDRDLKANLRAQHAAYNSAKAKLQRLEEFPRAEDLAAANANLKSAEAELNLTKNQYEMVQGLSDPRAISESEKLRRLSLYQQAEAKWLQAQADFDKIKSGTWKPDLEIARLEVQEAEANLQRTKTDIQRTCIESPIDGTVLQVKTHEGEFPPPDPQRSPMMIIGNTDHLYLRVTINQLDIPYFNRKAPAIAYLQGDSRFKFPLEFVRVEPYLVSKQNLTNELTEKVDTRVLNIIYRILHDHHELFVGQQMDVFIEAEYQP